MPVSEWTSVPALIKSALDNNSKCDSKSFDKFITTFKNISNHFAQQPALISFTKLLVKYMDLKSTRDNYNEAFTDAVLDSHLEKEEGRTKKESRSNKREISIKS